MTMKDYMKKRINIVCRLWLLAMAGFGSTVVFSQSPRTLTAIQIQNPGFESGLDGWTGAASMSLDRSVSYRGNSSAMLTVADPAKDAVYITQLVPIKGGAVYEASCYVKTENVRKAEAKMDSVGAGMIIEWADENGRWLQSGEYACGRWGTSDWRKMVCSKLMNAPEKARYAIIYLALRATGKAWFDEVSFSEVSLPTEKISPLNGSSLSNNCPSFAWKKLFGVRRYTLELSNDPDFPVETVRSFEVGGFESFQLNTPIPPGRWYWRVNSKGRTDPNCWSFYQQASAEIDMSAPVVLTGACRVLASNESFRVRVKDSAFRLPEVRFGSVKGRYCGSDERGVLEFLFVPPIFGWAEGLTEGTVTVIDGSGNKAEKKLYLLNAPRPVNSVSIEADGCWWQSGRRIFPLGIYEVPIEDMREVKAAGWDAVHSYEWEFSQDDNACRRYLDACWAADGLRAFIGFDRGVNSKNGIVQGNLAHVARRVGAFASHPALLCWYLFDEPEQPHHFVTADRLTEFADLVRALDPYHPVVMTSWASTMREYRRTWDTHWTQAYLTPDGIVRQIEEHRRYLEYSSPITLLVYCCDKKQNQLRRKGLPTDSANFTPDLDQMRASAFLSVVEECNGVFWWLYARHTDEYYTAAQSPHAWSNLKTVVGELRKIRPFLALEGEVKTGSVNDGDAKIEWWCKTAAGKKLLIAVNTSDRPAMAVLDIPGEGRQERRLGRYEVIIKGCKEK